MKHFCAFILGAALLAVCGCTDYSELAAEQKRIDAINATLNDSSHASSKKTDSIKHVKAGKMTKKEFWADIELIDKSLLKSGDEEAALQPLVDQLSTLDESKLKAFDEQLALALYEIDTRAHMKAAGVSNDSSDSFLYARCWVVAQGKDYFRKVVEDVNRMPTSLDDWCEALLNVSSRAWQKKNGANAEWNGWDTSVSYETGSNQAAWK